MKNYSFLCDPDECVHVMNLLNGKHFGCHFMRGILDLSRLGIAFPIPFVGTCCVGEIFQSTKACMIQVSLLALVSFHFSLFFESPFPDFMYITVQKKLGKEGETNCKASKATKG